MDLIEALFQKLGCNWHFFKSGYRIDTPLLKWVPSE